MTALEVLRQSSLFRDFSETGLRIFASLATERMVAPGVPIFAENTTGESLFLVKSGTVRLLRREGGVEQELGTAGPGAHLGELALLARTVRLVSAVAATPCEVLEIAQRDYYRLQPQKPQACLKLALAIAGDLAQRLQESRDALRSLAGATRS